MTFDMEGWWSPDKLPKGSDVLLARSGKLDQPLAYKFPHGKGTGVYTAFHNHKQTTDVEEALLRLLLMVPIAESSDASLTETYTGLVERDPSVEADGERPSTKQSETSAPSLGGDGADASPQPVASGLERSPEPEPVPDPSDEAPSPSSEAPVEERSLGVQAAPGVDEEGEETSKRGEPESKQPLAILPDEDTVSVGEALRVTVRDRDGSRVEGAVVRYAGKSKTTDSRGLCTLRFEEPGIREVQVDRVKGGDNYEASLVRIEVLG